jgi:hypothetical protein
MKFSFLALLISFRLGWARIFNPLFINIHTPKFFPTPRRTFYKEGLANYFFKN